MRGSTLKKNTRKKPKFAILIFRHPNLSVFNVLDRVVKNAFNSNIVDFSAVDRIKRYYSAPIFNFHKAVSESRTRN